jgi:hypothetical protein
VTSRSLSHRPSSPNLILGTADGYAFRQVALFIRTLKQTRTTAHVCLFLGPNIREATANKIESFGIEVIRYSDRFPFLEAPHPQNLKSFREPVHVCNYRYFLYYDYLLKAGGSFINVLLTDVRDVVFQRDPFDFPVKKDAIHVAMERSDIPIGACPWTAPWVRRAYGEETLKRVAQSEMSCSGTTLGPVAPMKRYLEAMLAEIARMKTAEAYLDQPAHNVLLLGGKLDPVERLYNFSGPILTAGSERTFHFDGQGQLVNNDGSVINMVHQYDRHDRLVRIFEKKAYPSIVERTFARAASNVARVAATSKLLLRAVLRKVRIGASKGP